MAKYLSAGQESSFEAPEFYIRTSSNTNPKLNFMKISSYCIAFFALLAFPSLLQGQLIQGIIQSSSGPIPHADVFIMDVGQSTTDDQGKFSISLRNCSYCQPGKEITI
ncbi:MAG: hypothetical protein AAFV25_26585, partial [Bacteroidota bacterium]